MKMKRILPVLLAILFCGFSLVFPISVVNAQPPPQAAPTGGLWVVDPEVTFIGKNAARSGLTLDWTLENYQWVCVTKVADRNCDNSNNPLAAFWWTIVQWIVLPLLLLVILATSMIIIVTRGRSLTIMRFIPRFTAVLILISLSYAILQFLYQFTDLIQGFFLRSGTNSCPPDCISQVDLLYVGWQYQNFVGLRLLGDYNAESAFISLLLTKLTALTYYVMVGILLIRKIILWFFIIISPIFPLLLLFYPVRNTGKIWIGEFFRWLLYGPLFAIFLQGLVFMWRQAIPLQFGNPAIQDPTRIIFPTAVNILLGGPKQFVTPTNSVNLTETFMLYVVALIMLWMVILLPWILLQIFLEYSAQFAGENAMMKNMLAVVSNKMVPPTAPGGGPAAPAGTALTLPFTKRSVTLPSFKPILQSPGGAAKEIAAELKGTSVAGQVQTQSQSVGNAMVSMPMAQINAEVISFANIPLPTMRDIARYDSSMVSNNASQRQEIMQMREMLEKIGNPASIMSAADRERYVSMNERLVRESQQGNLIATTILSAVSNAVRNQSQRSVQVSDSQFRSILQQIANPASTTNVIDRERMSQLNEMLSRESKENNNQLASTILSVNDKTTATELDKIRDQMVREKASGNPVASTVSNTVKATQIKSVLQQIANPASVSGSVEREKMSKIHDMLARESKENNNQLASQILQVKDTTTMAELEKISEKLEQTKDTAMSSQVLSSINSSLQRAETINKTKSVLQQIANPASINNAVEREKMSKIHDMLARESKENNNQLASQILSVKDTTTQAELEKISEKLQQTKESSMSSQVISTINSSLQQAQNVTRVKSVLQQIANPSTASAIDKEKMTKLHEALKSESQKGNELATSLLSVSKSTSSADIQKLSEKLSEARSKGVGVAADVLDIASKQVEVPQTNRIQTVTPEELAEVKKMWKENYQNMEVPEGMSGTRAEWMKDDVDKIGNLIGLLTSADQEQVNQGLSEVSNILPFLLVGGFSQAEIVSYLQTKQEAAKEVLESLKAEEETKVTVETKQASAQQAMAVSVEAPSVEVSVPQAATSTIVTPQVSNEILAMVNLKVPRMRDIARFDSMSLSRDKSKAVEVQKVKETLENIANPASVAVSTERVKFDKLREKLLEEGQKGNATASIVLAAAGASAAHVSFASIQASEIKNILTQIANPATVTSESEKESFNKLHEALLSESHDKKNELATTILSVNDNTSVDELKKIKEQLEKAQVQGNVLATTVISTVNKSVQSQKVRQVLAQIANPATAASTADRERLTKLHDSITKASQEGNELATSILSVNKSTSTADIQKLSEKLKEAQLKGESVASTVMGEVPQPITLPQTNRIQTVTPEELAEVKKMWKENYQNMEVPEGMSGTRAEWMKDDVDKIGNLIGLLTSADQEQVNQGLSEVSNILPFLLVGGFSQAEIVSYLQTKQEAAKEVLESLKAEEETKVTVETKQASAQQAMAVSVEAPSVEVSVPQAATSTIVTPQVSNEILAMVNLKVPSLKDIARYESIALSKDNNKKAEIQKMRQVLEKIAEPGRAADPAEKQSIEKLRIKLEEETQKGNATAESVLSASRNSVPDKAQTAVPMALVKSELMNIVKLELVSESEKMQYKELHDILQRETEQNKNETAQKILAIKEDISLLGVQSIYDELINEANKGVPFAQNVVNTINNKAEINNFKKIIQQIANPSPIVSQASKERFSKLHSELSESARAGNKLAQSILDVKPTTGAKEIAQLKKDLNDASKKDDKLAKSVMSSVSPAVAPSDNRLQSVSDKDYSEIEKMWEENYRTLPVPFGFSDDKKGRIEWIEKDIENISGTIALLLSDEVERKNEGMQKVGAILPFLLLGGFSYSEIVNYLRIKLKAANTVLSELKTSEAQEEKVDVEVKNSTEENNLEKEEEIKS